MARKIEAGDELVAPGLTFVEFLESLVSTLAQNLDAEAVRLLARQSAVAYRSIAETYPDAFVLTDLKMNVLMCNERAALLQGYESADEMIGAQAVEAIAPEDRVRAMENARITLEQGSVSSIEYTMLRKDGVRFPVELSASVIADGEGRPTAFLGVVRDISERKQAELALRHSEERYRALYQDNPTMYFTVDSTGTVLSVNEFGAEQLGYCVDELIGRPVLDVFYEEDKDDVVKQLGKCIASDGQVANWEFRKVKKSGEVIWVKESARATRDIAGNVIVLVVCEDISEHKRIEEALQKAREELESRVELQIQSGGAYGLSFRELTVLHLVAEGRADKEIGTVLGISSLTVNKHVANIRRKMSASSRTEAGVRALKEGLVT